MTDLTQRQSPDDEMVCYTCDHFHQKRHSELLPGVCKHPEQEPNAPTLPYDYCHGHSDNPPSKPGFHDHPSNPSTCQEWLENQRDMGRTMAGRCPCYKDD
ncbi:MAG: hypothetical protein ACWGQW_02540 [bacterium]